MHLLVTTRIAMATRFDLALYGTNLAELKAASEEALDEIERLDSQLNIFNESSEMCRLNTRAASQPIKVEPSLFRLLLKCRQLYHESGGTFDITIGSLMEDWGFRQRSKKQFTAKDLTQVRRPTGMPWVELNERENTVFFRHPGLKLDLGAIGKGYAIEQAAQLLRENGIRSGILHGGTSTVFAIGSPPEKEYWEIAIGNRFNHNGVYQNHEKNTRPHKELQSAPYATIKLRDEALSVSATTGKSVVIDEEKIGHIMDPRQGKPVGGVEMAAVALPSAPESDAFSTALLVCGADSWNSFLRIRNNLRALVAGQDSAGKKYCLHTPGLRLWGSAPS